MTRATWENDPSTATPLAAAYMNDLESRKAEVDEQAINVRTFPGGDAGQQLTNAIAALPTTGATLFLPRGLYTGAFDFTDKNHLTVTGEGSGTVIHNTTASDHALSFVDCDELTVSDLRVQGTSGTFDGLHLENCQRARVQRIYCKGTGRYGIYAHRCFGVVVDQCAVGIDSVSPYPTNVTNCTGGLLLTWDLSDASSGCNQFVINGGFYVIGKTQGWAIECNHCEGGIINGPIAEISRGGIILDTCSNLVVNGYYGEANPSDVEYTTGTVTTTNGSTAITGAGGTLWNTNDGEGNKNAMLGKFFIVGTTYGRIGAIGSDTAATLEANWGGASTGGQAYRMQSCDLYMKTTTNCTVNFGRGGGAVILQASSRNVLNLLTESIFLDATSNRNYGRVITNRASASATRMVDAGTGNRLAQISYQSGAMIANDPVVASDGSNVTVGGYVIGPGLVTNVTNGSGFLQLDEQSPDPGTSANRGRIFCKDNGSGKTQLCVVFGSGSPIVLATEV